MLLEMRNVFQKEGLMPEGDVVEKHQVLMELAHIPHVRNDWQVKIFLPAD